MNESSVRPEQLRAAFQAGDYTAVLTTLHPLADLSAEEWGFLGISLLRLGRFDECEQPLELAMALGHLESRVEYGNYLRATGQTQRAADHFQETLPQLDGELKYRTLRWYGVVLQHLGDNAGLRLIEEARRGYLAIGDQRMAARISHTLAAIHSRFGDFGRALQSLRLALPTLEQDSNPRPLLAALFTLLDLQAECGQLDEALETLERARTLAHQLSDEYSLLNLDAHRANLMLMAGDYGGYCELLEDLAVRGEQTRDGEITEYALSRLANHYSRVGEHVYAVRVMGRLRAFKPDLSPFSQTVLAMMALRRGDHVAALRMHLEVRNKVLERGLTIDATRSLLLAAFSAYAMNDLPRCAELLGEGLSELSAWPRSQSRSALAPELKEIEEMLAFARLNPNLAPLLEAALEDASYLAGSLRDDLFTSGMRLEIMTLGQELVLRDGIPCSLRTRGGVAVLAYLALHPRSTRQEVITHLWPEREPQKAATYFRQCISDIREAMGADVILVEGPHQAPEYRLSSKATVILDSQRVLQLVGAGQLPAAVAAYKGEFLPNQQESEWAEEQRIRIREALLGALHGELRAAQLSGDRRRVVLLATAIIEVDPLDVETEELRLELARQVSSPAEVARFEAERHRRMN